MLPPDIKTYYKVVIGQRYRESGAREDWRIWHNNSTGVIAEKYGQLKEVKETMQQMYSLQQTIPHHCMQKSEYRRKTYTLTQYILTQYKSAGLNVKPQNTR